MAIILCSIWPTPYRGLKNFEPFSGNRIKDFTCLLKSFHWPTALCKNSLIIWNAQIHLNESFSKEHEWIEQKRTMSSLKYWPWVALFKRPASPCMRKLIVSICLTKTQSKTESPTKTTRQEESPGNKKYKQLENKFEKKQKTKIKSWMFISFFKTKPLYSLCCWTLKHIYIYIFNKRTDLDQSAAPWPSERCHPTLQGLCWDLKRFPLRNQWGFSIKVRREFQDPNWWRYVSARFLAIFCGDYGDIPWNLGLKNRPYIW